MHGASSPISGSLLWNPKTPGIKENAVKVVSETVPAFRVLIVDRDSMSSDLLASALIRERKWDASAVEPHALLHTLNTRGADLVILGSDLNWQSGSCFDLAHQVSRTLGTVSIVLLLHLSSREMIINAFRSGARGVFSRQQPMSEFLDCIEHVRRGFIWVGRHETDFLLDALKSIPAPAINTDPHSPSLSTRELQVVKCAAEGKTNRAIAAELNLSEHTVKNYLFKAFEKLRVSSRVELLFYLTVQGHVFCASEPATSQRQPNL
jgi:DNA-binding NarL/FixJ family response regulator